MADDGLPAGECYYEYTLINVEGLTVVRLQADQVM